MEVVSLFSLWRSYLPSLFQCNIWYRQTSKDKTNTYGLTPDLKTRSKDLFFILFLLNTLRTSRPAQMQSNSSALYIFSAFSSGFKSLYSPIPPVLAFEFSSQQSMIRKGDTFYFVYDNCYLGSPENCVSFIPVIQEAQGIPANKWPSSLSSYTSGWVCWLLPATSLFPRWSKLSHPKSEDQRSNWRIVSYEEGVCLGLLCWFSLNGSQRRMELTSCPIAFPSKICSKFISFFPSSTAKPASSLTLMATVVSQWAIHYKGARVISFKSKSYLVP